MKKTYSIIYICFIALLFSSCSQEESIIQKNNSIENLSNESDEEDVLEVLYKMGYEKKDIEDHVDFFLVENDIVFYKTKEYKIVQQDTLEKQRRYTDGYVYMNEVSIFINPAMDANWSQAVIDAIDRYNDLDINLTLTQTTNQSMADIEIIYDFNISGGLGTFPTSDGKPGDLIRVNPNTNVCSLNNDTRRGIIQHELGHNLGLTHTDSSYGTQIPNTPSSDYNSIMNSGAHPNACSAISNGFTTGDNTALSIMYPFFDAFTVTIGGPVKGDNSGTYTWTAYVQNNSGPFVVEGGEAPYTYEWKRSNDGGVTYPYSWGNNTSSYSAHLPYQQDLYLRVIVTDANGVQYSNEHVTLNMGSIKP